MKKIFVSILVILGSVNSSFAVEIPSVMKQTMAQDPIGMPSLLNLVVSMVVVIGLIYVTGWIYAKLNVVNREKLAKLDKNAESQKFTVLQTMPLGQQRHIYSIEMNGKILLVGSTPSHINLIKEFDKNNNLNDSMTVLDETKHTSCFDVAEDNKKTIDIDELYKKYKN